MHMPSIVRRKRSGKIYYCLYHDTKGGIRRQYEKYLGKSVPPDVEERKDKFMMKVLRKEWEPRLRSIRDGFERECCMMPQAILEKQLNTFAVKFTYNTQRIEGSTLTLKDTALLLDDGITPASRPVADVLEAIAHRKVFLDAIREGGPSMDMVAEWHRMLFESTKKEIAGEIRDYDVRVGQSKFLPPPHGAVGALVRAFFEWYEANRNVTNPVELAALVHLKFVTIHPFGDGNGRVSRLMMNHALYGAGYPMMDVEYTDRRSYYKALERSQTKDVEWPFVQWFVRRYLRMYAKYLVQS